MCGDPRVLKFCHQIASLLSLLAFRLLVRTHWHLRSGTQERHKNRARPHRGNLLIQQSWPTNDGAAKTAPSLFVRRAIVSNIFEV